MEEKRRQTEIRSERLEPGRERRIFTFKATQFVLLLFGILEGILGLRFLLKLFAANPNSPIATLIYSLSGLFLTPFQGLTATPSAYGIVFEISTLFAMLIYGLVGWAVERAVWLIFYRPRGNFVEVTETKSQEDQSQHHEI